MALKKLRFVWHTPPLPDGRWRTIQLKLSRPELSARTRNGYRAPKG